eukprot:Tbor_TRINITY_DN2785_c0_g2::TRINITY_DN2785_c0_g2_i1::g.15282::m.15282
MSVSTSEASERKHPMIRDKQIDLSAVGISPIRSSIISNDLTPSLKAEEMFDLISESETIKRKIRLEYGDKIEEMMAEKGYWKYSSKTEGSCGLSTVSERSSTKGAYNEEEGIYTTARQRRLLELLSDSTPIRSSLMKAQEHALASLIDATRTGIEWELQSEYLRKGGKKEGSGSQEESRSKTVDSVVTSGEGNGVCCSDESDVAAVKEGLVKRLDLLLKMQAEHLQQQRCVSTTEDKKNLILKGERATYQSTNTDEESKTLMTSDVVDSPPRLVMGASEMAVEGVADM